jgi:mannose-6-phosphate isomerase-like protein (cupin superfamily)
MNVEDCKIVPKSWGREVWVQNSEEFNYCGKILEMNPGEKFSMHMHREKHESFLILSGTGKLKLIDTLSAEVSTQELKPNSVVVIPQMLPHQIINDGTEVLKIIEFSTFHRDSDSYRVWR